MENLKQTLIDYIFATDLLGKRIKQENKFREQILDKNVLAQILKNNKMISYCETAIFSIIPNLMQGSLISLSIYYQDTRPLIASACLEAGRYFLKKRDKKTTEKSWENQKDITNLTNQIVNDLEEITKSINFNQ